MASDQGTAAPVSAVQGSDLKYYELNEHQFGISSTDYQFEVSGEGTAVATLKSTGSQEVLPAQALGVDGAAVDLVYAEVGDGSLVVSAATPPGEMVASRGVAQCALGTVGATGAGALAGGLGGAAIGTVTLPIVGTVGAGLVGTIGGGLFGGMTGAAASCFG
ncbi:hypothetical protein [Arthrobacter sp. PAMC 25486]|uniref:hypothetical protein n=1 Tax=Arthrobacter sp. PAMC 25486 TaxID=1494608 RepID=UPI00068FFBB9|nr:hypothetical protein [Arthrobacter sp. PAMC 25486]